MRNPKIIAIAILLMGMPLAGCKSNPAPMNGHAETYDRTHLQFGNADLETWTRVRPVTAERDAAGLLNVTLEIRNVSDRQMFVDCIITYLRDGQLLETSAPMTVTLKPHLFATITLPPSSRPATDYYVSLSYAK